MDRIDDLATIERTLWSELARAPRESSHAWHSGVLATTDGRRADARQVVLRDVDTVARAVVIYTDSRSAKVHQLEAHPDATLVLWSPALGWQLRLRLQLGIETSGLAVSSRWARLKMSPAAHDYLSPLPPGSPIDRPLPERGTREHFAVLTGRVDGVDWLELHPEGHRRAAFDADGARWLVP